MAKKQQPYSPYGNLGSDLKKFFTGDGKEESGLVRAGRGIGKAIMTGGASVAADVEKEKDKPFGKALRRAGEIASTGVLTGGASVAPMVLGGDSYRLHPEKATPSTKSKPKAKQATTTTTVVPTKRPETPQASTKSKSSGFRGVQSWRGGDVPGQVRYDPGTKPNPTKKQRAAGGGAHDTKGLSWFK